MELGQSLAVPFLLFNIYNKFIKGKNGSTKNKILNAGSYSI
jgi:hypothetical protein